MKGTARRLFSEASGESTSDQNTNNVTHVENEEAPNDDIFVIKTSLKRTKKQPLQERDMNVLVQPSCSPPSKRVCNDVEQQVLSPRKKRVKISISDNADRVVFSPVANRKRKDEDQTLEQQITRMNADIAHKRSLGKVIRVSKEDATHNTITSALQVANPYDTIEIEPGEYTEPLLIEKEGIVLRSANSTELGGDVIIQTNTNTRVLSIRVSHVLISHVTIRQVTDVETTSSCPLVWINSHKSIIPTIQFCDIYGGVDCCIMVSGHAQPILQHNRIHGSKKTGVYYKHHTQGLLVKNDIFGNHYAAVCVRGFSNPNISHNRIHDGLESGIWLKENAKGVIEDNQIFANALPNICVDGKAQPLIFANKIFAGKQAGICVREEGGGMIDCNQIFDNRFPNIIISGSSAITIRNSSIWGGEQGGLWIKNTSTPIITGNRIFNNAHHNVLLNDSCAPIFEKNVICCARDQHERAPHVNQKGVNVKDTSTAVFIDNNVYGHEQSNFELGGSSRPILRNNRIFDSKKCGVFMKHECRALLEENHIYSNEHPNVCIYGHANPELRYNLIYSGYQSGLAIKEFGKGLIENNEIYGNSFANVKVSGYACPKLLGNSIHSSAQSGIWVKDFAQGVIESNHIYSNGGQNIFVEIMHAAPLVQNNQEG
jgi:parallel beta-helix repeat protein